MSEPTRPAVFLSYASQDADAARKICDALRAAGVEVWFDQSELRGGDVWDQKIRRQIKDCVLFVPIISANTNARGEGYFRLEWKLAVDRSHLMADDTPFLLPVVIDDTSDAAARVPDRFRDFQWMRLNVKDTPESLAMRVARLLSPRAEVSGQSAVTTPAQPSAAPLPRRSLAWVGYGVMAIALLTAGAFGLRLLRNRGASSERPALPAAAPGVAAAAVAPTSAPLSEARQLADRAFAMSVDRYDSTLDDYTTADALMKRALALDPDDGEVLARSAQLQLMFRNRGFDYSPQRLKTGGEQAERAVRLVPESPEAVMALSLAQRYTGNAAGEAESLRRVLKLAPNHARALLMLGSHLTFGGQEAEGLEMYRKASVEPQWAPLANYFEFLRFWATRRFAQADEAARRSYRTTPSANSAGAIAMLHLTWTGDLAKAAQEMAAVPPALLNTPRVVWLTAQVNLNRRAPDDALQVLDRLSDDFIRDSWYVGPKALLVGRAHALAGRMNAARLAWEAGLTVIDRQLQSEPTEPRFRRSRGELLAWLGRAAEALQEARTVEEINRGRVDSWNVSSATIYAVLGRADLAVPMLEKLIGADANWPLTTTLLKQDPLWDKIRDDPGFQKLLTTPLPPVAPPPAAAAPAATARDWPKDPELKRAVALLLGNDAIADDFSLAEEIARRTVDKSPADAEAVTVLALAESSFLLRNFDFGSERTALAKRYGERAVQLAPDDPEALYALAVYLVGRGGDPARAETLLRHACEVAPGEPRYWRELSRAVWAQRPQEGLALARQNVARFPRDALSHYELSILYRDAERWSDWEHEIDATLALAPIGNAMIWKARASFIHGDFDGMRAWLDRVPPRQRSEERDVVTRVIYAAFTRNYDYGLAALQGFASDWFMDRNSYTGPKALLLAMLLELQGKTELARVQYESALIQVQRHLAANPGEVSAAIALGWIQRGLGHREEARAAMRLWIDVLERPYHQFLLSAWWFTPIPACLLLGDRPSGLQLIREAATVPAEREFIRARMKDDPRMAPFRDDPEIVALLRG